MKLRVLAALIFISLFIGCVTAAMSTITDGRTLTLAPQWAPLVDVEEATDKLFAPGLTTTIGDHIYVPSLSQWLLTFPTGSPQQTAVLMHEKIHSTRQAAAGLTIWLAKYVADSTFRWQEEQLGYETEIRYLYANAIYVDTNSYATIWSTDYNGLTGKMVSYDQGLLWVTNLISLIQQGK